MIKNLVFSASGSNIFIHLGFLKYLGNNNGKSGDRTGKILNNVFQNFGN